MHEPDDDEAVDFEANIPASDRPLHETADSNRTELIEQALQSLPRDQRLALVLYHFEDMPYEEISKHLGVSLAKVKVDIHRARTSLARVLAQLGITAEEVRRSS
jgi:RNA polymerase sigma-70 factor (ECF subfamily)